MDEKDPKFGLEPGTLSASLAERPEVLDVVEAVDAKLDFQPGLYRHYKGGVYRALFMGRLSECRDIEMVIYIPLTPNPDSKHPPGQPWIRPFRKPLLESDDCWCDPVLWPDGVMRRRFMRIGD